LFIRLSQRNGCTPYNHRVVSVRGVSKSFDGVPVLTDIDLEIPKGQITAIMGSSGGGKTTLLRCISGLIVPEKGQILVDDVDVLKEPEEARRHMGMVFQSAALFDFLDVEDNVLFGVRRQLKLNPKQEAEVVSQALHRVGLEGNEHKMPAELSGGMRKRVGIARAIALKPQVMLYDEPTTGLDPVTTYTIDTLIVGLSRELDMTSLVVSHDVNSVFRTAEHVAFLHGGRMVFDGTPEQFKESDVEAIREILEKSQATTITG
jgi:phospholipid/cholesterol/gamma-HCH transport system ATP-binding protein